MIEYFKARNRQKKVLDDFKARADARAQKNNATNAKAKAEAKAKRKAKKKAKAKAKAKAKRKAKRKANVTELQVSDLNHGYMGYYAISVEEITAAMEKLTLGS